MKTRLAPVLAALLVVSTALFAAPAVAERTTSYAAWGPFTGTSNNYSTSFEIPVQGFPGASVRSDSRAGSVGIQSGASTFFGPNTPFGLDYGSSRDMPYLNLRPRADNATSPSVTTYTFEHPTPPAGWAVAFADIDADRVRVTAKDASGGDVAAADLGFQGGFNFCDSTPRPGTCPTPSSGDVPTWDPETQTLVGNLQAADTTGPVGWFEPTVSLSSLTATFTRRSGFPLYSTYFAASARTVSGTVADVSTGEAECPVTGVTVRLVSPYGESLSTTTPDANGAYTFGQNATQPGYTVRIEPPDACAAVGGTTRTVSNATSDATAAFSVREIIPQPVSGTVRADGQPLSGVTVTLHAPGGGTETTTTAADGTYLFDDNAIGDDYFVTIEVPDGYSGTDQRAPFDIDDVPVTGQDFALIANPDVSGTVSGGGAGLGGVTVTLTPSTGQPVTTVTDADGRYTFTRVPAGTYRISVEPPDGFDPAAPLTGVVVDAEDVPDQDFALTRPGAIGGEVVDASGDEDEPIEGASLTIDGPGAPREVVTDEAGRFFAQRLPAGSYEIELDVPDGFEPTTPTEQTAVITGEGEVVGDVRFAVEPVAAEPSPSASPSPSATPPSASPTTGSSAGSGSGDLPDTGNPVGPLGVLLGALLALGGVLLVALSRPRRRSGG